MMLKKENKPLNPEHSQRVWNHSPDGFNCGYGGSGPAQLALAILLKYLTEELARSYHQRFKWAVVAAFPQNENFSIRINLKEIMNKL